MGFNVCILLIFYTWINNVYRVSCYDQLVRPGYTMASSSSVGYGGYPNKTVDGDFRQNNCTYCMHTYPGHSEAWLRIDLRKIYNIHSVKFWYRNDSIFNTRRKLGFNIRLSNTSWIIPDDICYQDDEMTILPPIIEKQCEGVARFVWIYTNKLSIYGTILEVCEVQVFGCSYQNSDGNCLPCDQCKNDCNINGECDEQGCKSDRLIPPFCKECDNGTFGLHCRYKCSGHCSRGLPCNKVNGICLLGCADGWINPYCNETCRTNFYGKNCSSLCGQCAYNATCDHVTGFCPSGLCKRGWKNTYNKRCNEECDNGTFGLHCRSKCSGHCSRGIPCNNVNGICLSGCADGWINPYCNETCLTNFYGKNCSFICGHCANNATCDHVTGSCPSALCKRGWKNTSDKRCNKECENGTFGSNCQSKCSGHCVGGLQCNKVDGICTEGCAVGWINTYCNDTCQANFYGKNCSRSCGRCANNATCDHVTGSCPSGLCEPGWKNTSDKRCNEECENLTFGSNCKSKCSGHCAGGIRCNKVDGICTEGCADGWINPFCNDTTKQASECNSNQIVRSSLYGTIAALFLSILLNIFLIVRNAKKAFYMRQSSKKGNKEQDSTIETYVNAPVRNEENTAYQELTVQLNNPSIIDTEESNAGYQELGQLSQPSHYEELKRF